MNEEKRILKDELLEIDIENKEEMLKMINIFIEAFSRSFIVFGYNHEVTKDTLKLFVEFKLILDEEKKIYKFILKKSKIIDIDECFNVLDLLDELNGKTYLYYYKAFDDILDACDTKCPDRAKHLKKNFDTLIETSYYMDKVLELTLSLLDVKNSLNFEEEFWDYIDTRTIITYDKTEIDKCGIYEKNGEIELIIPHIINLETANMNKDIISSAYNLYKKDLVKKINKY